MFSFSSKGKSFDLEKYQQFVLKLRDKYHNHPECVFYRTKEEILVGDNILAKFKYQCSRHSSWDADAEHGTWNILWNPTLDPGYKCDEIHGRCSPATFKEVHDQLVVAFRGNFHVYDDDLAEYYDDLAAEHYFESNYDSSYDQYDPNEILDFAACSIDDCGYCGRCHY